MSNPVLTTKNLTKCYGKTVALNNISIQIEDNKIYGLLGRNGAGKTTLLNLISSRIFADSGEIKAFGENVVENAAILPKICYMPEKNLFTTSMKAGEIISAASAFFDHFDHAYADELCKKFELDKKKKYRSLSRGYESILRIVIGLASRAPLTMFDEPVLGLDAAVRDIFYRELIEDYQNHPRAIIISTHLIEESADVFNEIIMIKEGALIEQDSVDNIRERAFYISGKADLVDSAVKGLSVIHSETVANMKICAVYKQPDEQLHARLKDLDVEISPVPVQKIFIYLTDNMVGRNAE